jgi:hypothetical protein
MFPNTMTNVRHGNFGVVTRAADQTAIDPLEQAREERRRAEEEPKKPRTATTSPLEAICEDGSPAEAG